MHTWGKRIGRRDQCNAQASEYILDDTNLHICSADISPGDEYI
jgi:hypothetical protein